MSDLKLRLSLIRVLRVSVFGGQEVPPLCLRGPDSPSFSHSFYSVCLLFRTGNTGTQFKIQKVPLSLPLFEADHHAVFLQCCITNVFQKKKNSKGTFLMIPFLGIQRKCLPGPDCAAPSSMQSLQALLPSVSCALQKHTVPVVASPSFSYTLLSTLLYSLLFFPPALLRYN